MVQLSIKSLLQERSLINVFTTILLELSIVIIQR
jgi:hypothetical protein